MIRKSRNSKNKENIILDIIIICFGLMISSFGTALFYQAGMGSGAMATFCDGLHQVVGISYGTANMAANLILLAVLFFCDRKMIDVGTIMCVFLIGLFVDAGNLFWGIFPISDAGIPIRFLCVIIGCIMMACGLALYVAVERGFGALEGLVKYICKKTGMSFDKIKIGQDVLLIAAGILLRAEWGIGTIVSAIIIGPLMRVSIEKFQQIMKRENIA